MFDQFLNGTNQQFLISLGFALMCGIVIGVERELRKKPAGVSTQALVVVGATLFTFLSANVVGADKTRIAAQVVSGIGFLGAGLIIKIKDGKELTNVTTAASIWYAAAVGMAIGFGFHFIGVVSALTAVLISRIPKINSDER